MNDKIVKFNLSQRKNKDIPELQAGDIVKVHRKIVEGEKERTQIFEGMVIAVNGKQSSSPMVTVRKVTSGVGVELVLPIYSPSVEKIELVKRAKVRRSKLYYIRDKSAKSMRLKYKDIAEFATIEEEKVDLVSSGNAEGEKNEKDMEMKKEGDDSEKEIGDEGKKADNKKSEDKKEDTIKEVEKEKRSSEKIKTEDAKAENSKK